MDEKKILLDTYIKILKLSNRTRKLGLLSIELEINNIENMYLLRKGIQLVIDGIDSENISSIMDKWITEGKHEDYELKIRKMIKDGVLAIQNGDHPRLIMEKMLPYFGEETADYVFSYGLEMYSKFDREFPLFDATDVIEDEYKKMHPELYGLQHFIEKWSIMNEEIIQLTLRNIEVEHLIVALKISSHDARQLIYNNMSDRLTKFVEEEILKLKIDNDYDPENFRKIEVIFRNVVDKILMEYNK